MAGTIIADTWQNGNGTQNYKCRAWVNFNGTGTVAIRASGNVSSITDRGVGLYTVNFSTAMSDANYVTTGSTWYTGVTGGIFSIEALGSSTSKEINAAVNVGGAPADMDHINVVFFR